MTPTDTIAAFDFDGTLIDGDSVVPFIRRVAGPLGLARRSATRLPGLAAAAVHRDRDRLREVATAAAFTGRSHDEVLALGVQHGRDLVDRRLRTDTSARLRWHLDHGHRVVIVSASYETYLDVVATSLGVDTVLGTRLEVVDGRCTGRLAGANCRGPEKSRRLREWMRHNDLDPDAVTIWAYGDSAGDRELLEMADHPVWVGEPLASVAPTV